MVVNPGGIIYVRVRLTDCIESAYGVKRYQISGPEWLDSELEVVDTTFMSDLDY